MRIDEIATPLTNDYKQVRNSKLANWANVVMNPAPWTTERVTYYKSNNDYACPFTPGQGSVWFQRVDGKWEEFGEHGKYTYGHFLK